jgi:hypothetical protein
MSDTPMVKYSKMFTSFQGVTHGSREEILLICKVLGSMPLSFQLPPSLFPDKQYALGYARGKMIRIEEGGGILVHPMESDDGLEDGYVYSDPAMGIGWLLCKLGFGMNASNYEADVITYRSTEMRRPVRIAFEIQLTDAQRKFYKSLDDEGFGVSRDVAGPSTLLGSNLLRRFRSRN